MISVCMATYNGARFVKEQLESILSQLPEETSEAEVVVSDDGSSDDTLKIIRQLNDPRVRILDSYERSDEHLGPVYNFERALKAARGDLIFLSDQDDIWMKGKVQNVVETVTERASNGNSAVLVVHNSLFIDASGNDCGKKMWDARPFKRGPLRNWIKNSYTGCCMAFSRPVLDAVLPFPKNLPMHDQWIGLMTELLFGSDCVIALDSPLIQYRLHENNATHLLGAAGGDQKNVKRNANMLKRLKWRFNLLKSLLQRRSR